MFQKGQTFAYTKKKKNVYHKYLRKRVCILYSGLYIEIDQGKVKKYQIKVTLL